MSQRDIEAIVAGHVCLDIIPRFPGRAVSPQDVFTPGKLTNVEEAAISTGGAVSNTGIALAKLGVKPTLAARVGRDDFGRLIRERLARFANTEGLVESPAGHSSYTCVIAPPGIDRIFFHCPGANDEFGPEDLPQELCARAKLFHFGYPPLMRRMYADGGSELAELFRKAQSAGATTSLDMALPDPQSESGRVDWRALLQRLLPHVDLFHPSIEEALFMAERAKRDQLKAQAAGRDLIDLLDGRDYSALSSLFLAWGAAIVSLKSGPRGFYLRSAARMRLEAMGAARPADLDNWTSREIWSPAFRPPPTGSATGSGDSALAGFLTAFLRGETIESAAACANAMGYQNLHALDAVSGIADWPTTLRIAGDRSLPRLPFSLHSPGWRFDPRQSLWLGPADRAPGESPIKQAG